MGWMNGTWKIYSTSYNLISVYVRSMIKELKKWGSITMGKYERGMFGLQYCGWGHGGITDTRQLYDKLSTTSKTRSLRLEMTRYGCWDRYVKSQGETMHIVSGEGRAGLRIVKTIITILTLNTAILLTSRNSLSRLEIIRRSNFPVHVGVWGVFPSVKIARLHSTKHYPFLHCRGITSTWLSLTQGCTVVNRARGQ